MEKFKMIIGFILLPFAFFVWILDRIMYVLMPQSDHAPFQKWLSNDTIGYALARLITAFLLRWLFYWIFGL